MPKKYEMNWEGAPQYRWYRNYKKVKYRVTCQQLGCMVWTEEATYKAANEWWRKKLAELYGPTPRQRAIAEIDALAAEIAEAQQKANVGSSLQHLVMLGRLAEYNEGPDAPEIPTFGFKTALDKELYLNEIEKAKADFVGPTVASELRLDRLGSEFLDLLKVNQRPSSFRESKELIEAVCEWYGGRCNAPLK